MLSPHRSLRLFGKQDAKSITSGVGRWLPINQVIIKPASRCNLNCSYCYVYNKADSTWRDRPSLMSDATFHAAIRRTQQYCDLSGQKHVRVGFHGGEPCLLGAERFSRWCSKARELL